MKRDVLISLVGTQDSDGKDIIEMMTVGEYHKKGDTHFITYEESELTGMEGTVTTLIAEPKKVTILRKGTSNSMMVFESGQKHFCCYETPHGEFTIGVRSNNVSIDLSDNGGEISAQYAIDVDNVYKSDNDFLMKLQFKN